ncbi:hypothetical protein AB5I41_27095 [Sphingomonas sp. MMS24-JH45]
MALTLPRRAGRILLANTLVALVTALTLMPLAWMVTVSFMPRGEANHFPPPWPSRWSWENYHEVAGAPLHRRRLVRLSRPARAVEQPRRGFARAPPSASSSRCRRAMRWRSCGSAHRGGRRASCSSPLSCPGRSRRGPCS